ncbi:mitochondrial carrier homolog 2-like [Artemia franciscana]|uniref:Uncharacterized protein n=1 Tax=Artemia franciscana TaxID=6661 RepID=A0AA88HQV4_ARTSF|nr:hypothetical protein QYM36_010719 [Artemia franciscana]
MENNGRFWSKFWNGSNNKTKKNNITVPTILDRGLARAIIYPFEYAKILIQIGCEPLEPVSGRSLLGHVMLFYPNLAEYTKYIYQRDGFLGLYRGFIPWLFGYTLGDFVYQEVTKLIRFEGDTPDSAGLPLPGIPGPFMSEFQFAEEDVSDESLKNFLQKLAKCLAGRLASVIASQPFMVVATRMCGQFVGRETLYKGILPSVREIFSREGIQGFFAGIIPRLIGEFFALVITGSVAFAVKQFFKRGSLRECVSLAFSVLVSRITYPLQTVSTTMAINNSRIVAGLPPFTPLYGNWYECWRDLRQKNQSMRGANVFFRAFTGPQTIINDVAYPMGFKKIV